MKIKIKQLLIEETGQDIVEYSLILVLIGTVVMIYLTGVGQNVTQIWQKVSAHLELVSSQISE